MHFDCGYQFSVFADGYVPYGEYGFGPHPDIYRFYADVRLAPIAAAICSGDCQGDHEVSIDDLLCAVDALLTQAASGCLCADADGDGSAHIGEIVIAVHNALTGCVDCGDLSPQACVRLHEWDLAHGARALRGIER